MEENKIYNDILNLPPEAQKQVSDFVDFLKFRYLKPQQTTKIRKGRIIDSPFIGIWKNRKDMSNSTQWVRDLRKNDWDVNS